MTDKEVLSQEEVDALIQGVDEGEVNTNGKSAPEGEVQTIDFGSQERVVRSQFPVLERIHERLSRKFSELIYQMMSREINVEFQDLQIIKYSELMAGYKLPTAINIARFHPLRGKGMLVFNAELIYSLIENYFGGKGQFESNIEEREFTRTEIRVMEIVMQDMIGYLENAWKAILKLKIELLSRELNPQLVSINSPNDMVVVSRFEFQFDEKCGFYDIVMPYAMLEPIRDQLDMGAGRSEDDADPNWARSLLEQIYDVKLNLNATLAQKKLTLQQMANLKAGDVIPIDLPEIVSLDVEKVPMFNAKVGKSNDKCALKIIQRIQR